MKGRAGVLLDTATLKGCATLCLKLSAKADSRSFLFLAPFYHRHIVPVYNLIVGLVSKYLLDF